MSTSLFTKWATYGLLGLGLVFQSCSKDEGNKTEPSEPSKPKEEHVVTSVANVDWTSSFKFTDGVMTEASTVDGIVKITDTAIQVKDVDPENSNYLYTADFTNLKKKDGCITSADYKFVEKYDDGGFKDHSESTGVMNATYTADGYISTITISGKEEDKIEGTTNDFSLDLEYEWKDGNLMKITLTGTEGSMITEYTYSSDAPKNTGVYHMLLDEEELIPEFMWYAGLLGKAGENIPTTSKGKYESYTYSVELDSQNRVEKLYTTENGSKVLKEVYAYDGKTAVFPQP